ncbi:hypothetical protein Rhal01_02563 [Rubritalea halochordaticola]|uniref:Uncharacterized protein n=1 Tax=Rubritalea halochordaticola TaxID=714537 RepID=A0ABP9V182_9BACT
MKTFKRLILTALILLGLAVLVIGISLYPRLSNMKSEYHTVGAIDSIRSYLEENDGQWPSSPEQLQNEFPPGGIVYIDYSATSRDLIKHPEKLREAVRPRSGKFYTYPHYEHHLEQLLITLQDTNRIKFHREEEQPAE